MASHSFWDRVKPWECATCGMKNISANKDACPKCHTARHGTAAAVTQDATGQTTVTYTGQKEMEQGIATMAAAGWAVKSQAAYQPGSGVGRVLALGVVGALVFKPNTKFVVVFERVAH